MIRIQEDVYPHGVIHFMINLYIHEKKRIFLVGMEAKQNVDSNVLGKGLKVGKDEPEREGKIESRRKVNSFFF